tara:strand:+ start:502 stop:972 length:471 start_codon:yes stop_codon:yes gene_type:complete
MLRVIYSDGRVRIADYFGAAILALKWNNYGLFANVIMSYVNNFTSKFPKVYTTGASIAHYAARAGNVQALQLLHDLHFDMTKVDNQGRTVAHYAAAFGRLDCLQRLASFGSTLTNVDNFGMTPLNWAGYRSHMACWEFLQPFYMEDVMMLVNIVSR